MILIKKKGGFALMLSKEMDGAPKVPVAGNESLWSNKKSELSTTEELLYRYCEKEAKYKEQLEEQEKCIAVLEEKMANQQELIVKKEQELDAKQFSKQKELFSLKEEYEENECALKKQLNLLQVRLRKEAEQREQALQQERLRAKELEGELANHEKSMLDNTKQTEEIRRMLDIKQKEIGLLKEENDRLQQKLTDLETLEKEKLTAYDQEQNFLTQLMTNYNQSLKNLQNGIKKVSKGFSWRGKSYWKEVGDELNENLNALTKPFDDLDTHLQDMIKLKEELRINFEEQLAMLKNAAHRQIEALQSMVQEQTGKLSEQTLLLNEYAEEKKQLEQIIADYKMQLSKPSNEQQELEAKLTGELQKCRRRELGAEDLDFDADNVKGIINQDQGFAFLRKHYKVLNERPR
jgi:hypothetical protein